jgi:predicted nucleic acid-binding protein
VVDLAALLRRQKPERQTQQLVVRDRSELNLFADLTIGNPKRPKLLLDTNVYIRQDDLSGDELLKLARCELHHSSVALSEFVVGLSNSSGTPAQWAKSVAFYNAFFDAVPLHRTHAPDHEIWIEAGILAGTLARIQGYQKTQRKDALNDALIFLTAKKHGLTVLTADVGEFDLLQQMMPSVDCIFL